VGAGARTLGFVPTAGQLLAIAAVITAITGLVAAVAGMMKMFGELRVVREAALATRGEVAAVKDLVNGNHHDLVDRLDAVTAQRDEARARHPRDADRDPT